MAPQGHASLAYGGLCCGLYYMVEGRTNLGQYQALGNRVRAGFILLQEVLLDRLGASNDCIRMLNVRSQRCYHSI